MSKVEWKNVEDSIISLRTGLNPRQNFKLNLPGYSLPYITGKDIYNNRVNVSSNTDKIDSKAVSLINKRACLEKDLLLFASTGTGTVGRMAIIDSYNNDWAISETLYAIKTSVELTPKFLMYVLYSDVARKQFEPKISKGSVPHLKIADLLKVNIPIPSLAKQNWIVKILDTFTSSIENLKEQIAQRRKQYEHYRDQLLDLEGKEGVEIKYLGDIAFIKTGNKPDVINDISDYKYINAGTSESGFVEGFNCLGDVTTTPSRGQGGIGYVGFQASPFWLGPLCYQIRSLDNKVYNKYIYYYLSAHNYLILKLKSEGGTPAVNAADLKKITFMLPPLAEQQSIVDILDKFEASIQNLEAQLSLREKQYEYYRNKLLTFE